MADTGGNGSGRFKVVRTLGSGGMGDVHLAEDSKLQRLVAIKTIKEDLCQDEEIRKRIERECLLHAKIGSHPHIVTLFDRLEDGDRIELIMEYVEGETLHDRLDMHAKAGTRLPWKQGVTIATQTLEALSRIHAQGIVHRDIKPSNILLARDDSGGYCAKLMDFGIARMATDDEKATMLTQEGTGGPGTPVYMAPEQIDPATFGAVSPATDVYAMGIMLYQILSGKPPFLGTLTEIFGGHLNKTPPPLEVGDDPVRPQVFRGVIEKALAKRPADRYESAKEFREALLQIMEGSGAEQPAGGKTMPVGTAHDPNRTLTAAEAGAQAVAAGGGTMLDTSAGKPARSKMGLIIGAVVGIGVLGLVVAAAGAYFAYNRFIGPAEPTETSPVTEQVEASVDIPVPGTEPPAGIDQNAVPGLDQPPGAVYPGGIPQASGDIIAQEPNDKDEPDDNGTQVSLMNLFDEQRSESRVDTTSASPPPAQASTPAPAPVNTTPAPKPEPKPTPKPAPKPEPEPEPAPRRVQVKDTAADDNSSADDGGGWRVIRKEDHKVNEVPTSR